MPLDPISLGISAIPSVFQGIQGLFQVGKGNRLAKANIRPVEQVNPLIAKNAALAEQMGQNGMASQQYNNALNNIGRNQAGAYRQAAMGGNNNIASLLRAGNDATMNLDVKDQNDRLNNQRFAFGQRGQLAQEQNRVFDWNHKQKYREQAAAAAALQGAGRQNTMGAVNSLSQLGQYAMMGQNGGGGEGNPGEGTFSPGSMLQKLFGKGRNSMNIGQAGGAGISPNMQMSSNLPYGY